MDKNGNADASLPELIDKHFDLDAYEPLKQMESKDWGIQLFIRKSILDELSESITPSEALQKKILKLLENPISSYDNYPFALLPYNSTVSDLTVAEAHTISEKYSNNGVFKIIDDSPEDEDSLTHTQQDLQNIFDLCVSSAGNDISTIEKPKVIATIDLSASDTQLKEDFGDYLNAKRKELSTEPQDAKKFKAGKFAPLIKHKVLQYIDLKILDIFANGVETLKHHELADRLFPPEGPLVNKDTTEAVRKSTIKYANEMLNEGTIKSLLISAGKLPFSSPNLEPEK